MALAPARQQDDMIPITLTTQHAMQYLNYSKAAIEQLTARELRRFVKEVDEKEKSSSDLHPKTRFERRRKYEKLSRWPEFELVFESKLKQEYIKIAKLHEKLSLHEFPIDVTKKIFAFLHLDMQSMKLEIILPPCLQVCTGWKKLCNIFEEKISYFQAEALADQIFEHHQQDYGCGPLDAETQYVSLNTNKTKLNNSALIQTILEKKFEGYVVKFKDVNMQEVGIDDKFRFEVEIKKPESLILTNQTRKRTQVWACMIILLTFMSYIHSGYVVISHVPGAFHAFLKNFLS